MLKRSSRPHQLDEKQTTECNQLTSCLPSEVYSICNRSDARLTDKSTAAAYFWRQSEVRWSMEMETVTYARTEHRTTSLSATWSMFVTLCVLPHFPLNTPNCILNDRTDVQTVNSMMIYEKRQLSHQSRSHPPPDSWLGARQSPPSSETAHWMRVSRPKDVDTRDRFLQMRVPIPNVSMRISITLWLSPLTETISGSSTVITPSDLTDLQEQQSWRTATRRALESSDCWRIIQDKLLQQSLSRFQECMHQRRWRQRQQSVRRHMKTKQHRQRFWYNSKHHSVGDLHWMETVTCANKAPDYWTPLLMRHQRSSEIIILVISKYVLLEVFFNYYYWVWFNKTMSSSSTSAVPQLMITYVKVTNIRIFLKWVWRHDW